MGIRTRVLFCTAPRCKQGRESTFTRSRNIKNARSRRIVFFFFFVKYDSCTPSCTSPIAVSLREDASFCRRGGLGEWTAARLPRNPRLACAGGPPRPGHGAAPAAQEDAMRPRCCSPPMQNASQAAHRAEQTCGPLDAEPGGGTRASVSCKYVWRSSAVALEAATTCGGAFALRTVASAGRPLALSSRIGRRGARPRRGQT